MSDEKAETNNSEQPIPMPLTLPVVGSLFALDLSAPGESVIGLYKKYNEIYHLKLKDPFTVVCTQKLINEVCDDNRFRKSATAAAFVNLRPIAGDGLFTAESDSAVWAAAHRILMPVFGPVGVANMHPAMLDIALQLTAKLERIDSGRREWLVAEEMTRLTIDTIALCAFNYRLNSFYSEQMPQYANAMFGALQEAMAATSRPAILDMFMSHAQVETDCSFMNSFCDSIIVERKAQYAECGITPEPSRDLLDRMLLSSDPVTGAQLSAENVRFQLNTFLVAGHETTSALLSFALYFLARSPQVLHNCEVEIEQKLQGRVPSHAEVKSIGTVQRVLNETLRLQPPVGIIAREVKPPATEATLANGKYRIANRVGVNIFALQRDPAVWGERADEFLPDVHFADGVERPPNSFKAFGTGMRACIGSIFAMDEAALALTLLIQRFQFIHDPNYELKVINTLTRKPAGFKLRFKLKPAVNRAPLVAAPSAAKSAEPAAVAAVAKVTENVVHVLYGSNSGTCESFARATATAIERRGVPAQVRTLDAAIDLFSTPQSKATNAIVVVPSYEGQPPDNARKFVAWISEAASSVPNAAAPLSFAVFGVGHRDWKSTFMRIPRLVDEALERIGGKRMLPLGAADVSVDAFGAFDAWLVQLWDPLLGTVLGKDAAELASKLARATSTRIEPTQSALVVDVVDEAQRRTALLQQADLVPVVVIDNVELCGKPRDAADEQALKCHSVRHVKLQLPADTTFQCGNYVAVLPISPYTLVQRALTRFGFTSATVVIVRARSSSDQARAMLPIGEPVLATVLLEQYVELTLPATRAHVELLVAHTTDATSKAELQHIVDDFANERSKRKTLLELLEAHPRCAIDFGSFVDVLPAIRPRLYSISSSPRAAPHQCTLTVDVLDERLGAASQFLSHARQGDKVRIAVRPSHAFVVPNDDVPLLMISAGSGIAPFRGFVQHRALAPGNVAEAHLFTGHRHPFIDALYASELDECAQKGAVSIYRAFSRIEGVPKRHVQDELWSAKTLINRLVGSNVHIFVCGSTELARSVRATLVKIVADQRAISEAEAEAVIDALQVAHRYAIDVFSPPN
jgi:cytochrome P450/NADPH-cytochrome P450 reductase